MRITRRQLRRIIRETSDWRKTLGPPPDMDAPGWHPNMSQEWEREAEAGWRAEVAAEKKAFLTSGVQARWEDQFQIDDDDEAKMIQQVLSDAYDKIWKKVW